MTSKLHNPYQKYPQRGWAQVIEDLIKNHNLDIDYVVDAPCGNGIITYFLADKFKNLNFLCSDLNVSSVSYASKNIVNSNVEIKCSNIFDLSFSSEKGLFLLINSLFLLPETDKLLDFIRLNNSYMIGIFPYVERDNFQAFVRKRPDYEHTYLPTQDELITKLEAHGFSLMEKKDISYVHHHKYPKLPYVYNMFLKLLTLFTFSFRQKKSAYWIGLFKIEKD